MIPRFTVINFVSNMRASISCEKKNCFSQLCYLRAARRIITLTRIFSKIHSWKSGLTIFLCGASANFAYAIFHFCSKLLTEEQLFFAEQIKGLNLYTFILSFKRKSFVLIHAVNKLYPPTISKAGIYCANLNKS